MGHILGLLLTFAAVSFWGTQSFAQSIPLQGLDKDEFGRLVGDFSAVTAHSSVSGASPLGSIFGFEVGVVGGVANTPEVNKLVHDADPNAAAVNRLPNATALGVLTVPLGITVEAGLLPKIGSNDFKFGNFSLAAKWTFSELLELPLNLAVKAQFTKTQLEFKSTTSGVDTKFNFDNTITGLTLLASKDLGLIEPYAGLGILNADGKLSVTGSSTVFDPSLTQSQSATAKKSGTTFLAGVELKLLVVKFGVEYASLFKTSRYLGKVSFYF